jgi:hypothetical protein
LRIYFFSGKTNEEGVKAARIFSHDISFITTKYAATKVEAHLGSLSALKNNPTTPSH